MLFFFRHFRGENWFVESTWCLKSHLLYLVDFLHVFVARFAANEI